MKKKIMRRVRRFITALTKSTPTEDFSDIRAEIGDIVAQVRPYTMTSVPRIGALVDSVNYAIRRGIPGALVECGVWRGGSVLAMILTLQRLGVADRDIYLYDTFEGMTAPTKHDVSAFEADAMSTWKKAEARGERPWSSLFAEQFFGEIEIRQLLMATNYPSERIHLVRGPVEHTLPRTLPKSVALLRLDTDWYESTLHELEHLYPQLAPGGVLIIDDYGHWKGCRKAVHEYFNRPGNKLPLLTRVDYTGRVAVKC